MSFMISSCTPMIVDSGISDASFEQHVANMSDGTRRVQALGAHGHAVHDAAAAEHAEGILQIRQALVRARVTAVHQEAVGLQEACRTDELVGVPPERGTIGRTAGTEDALV